VRVPEALLDQVDRKVGDIDADPLTAESDGRVDCCSASTKGVKYHVAFIARRPENQLHEGDGLLCRIPESFSISLMKGVYVRPYIVT
jgi:hypothetical protein